MLFTGRTKADDGAGADRVLFVDGCDGTTAGVPCVGGEGTNPGQLRDPHGLLIHDGWDQLLVADGGNARVQRFDRETSQLVGVWDAADGLVEPWALALDGAGGVLVVDTGRNAVLAFDATGRATDGPWPVMAAGSPPPERPIGIATTGVGDHATVYVLDGDGHRVLAYDRAGRIRGTFGGRLLRSPLAIAASERAIYVGDNALRRVVVFRPNGEHIGELDGFHGPVAALAVGPGGDLFVHPGPPFGPLACDPAGAYSRDGVAWGGPFSNPGELARAWHRLAAVADVPDGAHLQLFAYAASVEGRSPVAGLTPPWSDGALPLAESLDDDGLSDERWLRVPVDATAAVVHALKRPTDDGLPAVGAAAAATRLTRLWIGISLTSDGATTASVEQLRVDFDLATGLEHLPAIFAQQPASSRFLGRYLALAGTTFDDIERRIDALPARFDPAAAPPDGLVALAGWLALDIDGEWSEPELRAALAGAFDAYGRRGTVAGLREAVRQYARADVHIVEPLMHAGWWLLEDEAAVGSGEPSGGPSGTTCATWDGAADGLDFGTMLAAVEAQGAVLGTTAVVDGSQLLARDEEGMGLFSNLADRFTALVYQGARYSPERLDEIRAVIDREKPATTDYEVCVDRAIAPNRLSGAPRHRHRRGGRPPPGGVGRPLGSRARPRG